MATAERKHATDFRVAVYKRAEELLDDALGQIPFFATRNRDYRLEFEVHPLEIDHNTPWNNLPHIKWKDANLKVDGHIYF